MRLQRLRRMPPTTSLLPYQAPSSPLLGDQLGSPGQAARAPIPSPPPGPWRPPGQLRELSYRI